MPLSPAKSGPKKLSPRNKSGKKAVVPDLLVSNDDVFNLDSIGDLLNDAPVGMTAPTATSNQFAGLMQATSGGNLMQATSGGNLMQPAPGGNLMQPSPAAGLMQPSNTSMPPAANPYN